MAGIRLLFVFRPAQISEAEERVDPKLQAQIEFSRLQVERFARLQRASLVDFQVETLPGSDFGTKADPGECSGFVRSGRQLSAYRLGLDDDRGSESRRRSAGGRCRAAAKGIG